VLLDANLSKAITHLHYRERAASRGRDTARARKDLDDALSGLHPPSKPRGPESKLSAADLVGAHFTAVEVLRKVRRHYRRNEDALAAEIASRFGLPIGPVKRSVIPCLCPPRSSRAQSRYAEASFRVLSLQHRHAPGTIKRLLTESRRRSNLTVIHYRVILRELLAFRAEMARAGARATGLKNVKAEFLSRLLARYSDRSQKHIRGLSTRKRLDYLLRNADELRGLSRLHSHLSMSFPAFFEHRNLQ
jgi:hypothetical protein